jgi:glycosyltransferase involved in cell wall biosynthesis
MKLIFIGAINQGNLPKGGEEYKNQILINKINVAFNDAKIIDTFQWIKRPKVWTSLLLNILIKRVDIILISASSVSTYRLLNLMHRIKPSLLRKTTYLVIGGYFPEGIRSKRFDWRFYKNLKNVVVQGDLLRKTVLANSGLTNVKVVPNFKAFPNFPNSLLPGNEKLFNIFRFVFVGRLSGGKGISEILDAVKILNKLKIEFVVDFYGPVVDDFQFDSIMTRFCGFLDFQNNPGQAYAKLASYDCMLFPTYWKGEGFPGVIIDAFIAGLPVIATDWNMNTEIIKDGVNGFIIPPNDTESLANKMNWVLENRETLKEIRVNNQAKANEYHIDRVWPELFKYVV